MDKKLLDALAARAEQRTKDRKNAKQFEVAGEMLTFVQPSVEAKLSYAEAMLSESAADTVRACASLIYDCCPDLQDPELHKALGVTDPYDTVWTLMQPYEVDQLGGKLYRWLGLIGPRTADGTPDTTRTDTVKN